MAMSDGLMSTGRGAPTPVLAVATKVSCRGLSAADAPLLVAASINRPPRIGINRRFNNNSSATTPLAAIWALGQHPAKGPDAPRVQAPSRAREDSLRAGAACEAHRRNVVDGLALGAPLGQRCPVAVGRFLHLAEQLRLVHA